MKTETAGLAIWGLAQMHKKRNQMNEMIHETNGIIDEYDTFVFRARSHVHGLRASVATYRLVEDQLIAALKAENANHPLASREKIDSIFKEIVSIKVLEPEIIKRTYPDGKLPEGAIVNGGTHKIDD